VAVLSGDLSLLGHEGDIEHARDWWNAESSGRSSTYVLGNHDYWGGDITATISDSLAMHQRIFEMYRPPDSMPPLDVEGTRVRFYTIDTTPLRLVRNFLALGELRESALTRLENEIRSDRESDRGTGLSVLRIVVMHHPMLVRFARAGTIDKIRRRPPGATLRAMRRNPDIDNRFYSYGVGLVLAGHTHRWAVNIRDFRVIQAISASSTVSKPPGYWVHQLTPGGSTNAFVESKRFEYQPDVEQFTLAAVLPPCEIFVEPPSP